jgi:transcriptional regulator with XRE-family HTH domain
MPKSLEKPTADAAGMQYPDRVTQVTWWRYVMTVTGNAAQKDIATATGIDQSSISRWQRGTNTPSAEAVVAFARCTAGLPSKLWWPRTNCPALELGVVERRR